MKRQLKKYLPFVALPFFIGFTLSCVTAKLERKIASDGNPSLQNKGERLIVAEHGIGTDPDRNKILLIGIDQHEGFDHTSNVSIDVSRDFKSYANRDLTQVDPKFLIAMNRNGIQSVYAFNSHKIKTDPKNPDKEGLPQLLVDATHLSKEIALRTPVKKALTIAGFLPGKMTKRLAVFAWLFGTTRDAEDTRETTYFLQLLDGAMFDQSYPDLQHYFPNDYGSADQIIPNKDLCTLGAVMSLRYHPTMDVASVFARESSRAGLYCEQAVRLRSDSNNAEENFSKELQGKHIYLERIGRHFTVASYDPDPSQLIPKNVWSGHGTENKSPVEMENILEKWRDKAARKEKDDFTRVLFPGDRIPYAIISDSSNKRYVTILRVFDTNRVRLDNLLRNLYYFAEATQTIMLLSNPALSAATAADDAFQNWLAWRQSTFLENTSFQYGRLLEYLQTADALDFDWSHSPSDTWLYTIDQKLKLPPAERAAYIAAISDRSDNVRRNSAINDLISRSLIVEGGVLGFHDGGRAEPVRMAHSRLEHWQRLSNFLGDPQRVAEFESYLNSSAERQDVKELKSEAKVESKAPEVAAKQASLAATYAANSEVVPPKVCYVNDLLTTSCPPEMKNTGRPVILFAVDGLRPDFLDYAATRKIRDNSGEVDLIPNIKKYFLNRGTHFNAFTEHSVSIASFATILSGFEPDYHGLIVANSASRDPKMVVRDYLDNMSDNHLIFFANEESLGLQRIHEAGVRWLGDYLEDAQKITVLAPIHDKKFVPYKETGIEGLHQLGQTGFGVLDDYAVVDLGQALHIANLIRANPGSYRFVENYYVSVDHVGHVHTGETDKALHVVDKGIGVVMDAASHDPSLKNAVILLVSDHGLSGGMEYKDPLRTYIPANKEIFVDNEKIDMHSLFTGDLPEYPEYRFAIGTATDCEVRDLPMGYSYDTVLSTINTVSHVMPNHFDTCRGTRTGDKNKGRSGYTRNRTMYLESQGDGRETALILDDPKHPLKRLSYYQLTHYSNPEMVAAVKKARDKKGLNWQPSRNIVADLLSVKSSNFQTPEIKNEIMKLNGLHGVDVVSIPIQGEDEKRQLEILAGVNPGESTRDPVLVQSLGPDGKYFLSALIFVQDGADFRETRFRYVLVPGFDQGADGKFSFAKNLAPFTQTLNPAMTHYDPFRYHILRKFVHTGEGGGQDLVGLDPKTWYTDRQILNILLANENDRGIRERRPTAIPSIVRILTLNKNLQSASPSYYEKVEKMIPDFAIWANEGFEFSLSPHEADHGGLRRSEVQTTMMITDLAAPARLSESYQTALTRDITPTVLDYLGVPSPDQKSQGRSLRPVVESSKRPAGWQD